MRWIVFLLLLVAPACALPKLELLDARQGRVQLQQVDDFIRNLSPFDRQSRLQSANPVSQAEFLDFVSRQATDWPAQDAELIHRSWERVAPALERFPNLLWPDTVRIVRTTGREEGGAAYTRGQTVVLPANMLRQKEIDGLLTHELFHVLSRHQPELRWRLYEMLGFQRCPQVELPPELARRRITNPDAPNLDCCWSLHGRSYLPLLLAKSDYDPKGGRFFSFLQFRLLDLENPASMLDPRQVPEYWQRYTTNTEYVIHPEETLAENFVLLALKRPVKDVKLLEQIEAVLRQ